jgi:hydroxypyruvate isomerase
MQGLQMPVNKTFVSVLERRASGQGGFKMFELSVNLEYMFQEAGEAIEDRVAAAAAAGYRYVEFFSTANRDIDAISKALKDNDTVLWTVVTDPRTMLVDPDTHETFRGLFRQTAESARTMGCTHVVVGSGLAVPYQKRPEQLETVAKAVSSIVPIAEELGVTIFLEAVNIRHDHPGVLFSRTEDSVAVARAVDSPRVRILYDMYHSITEGEDPSEVLPPIIDLVDHVQIADVPGRGEPGTGTVDWPAKLQLLKDVGYEGLVGVECQATRTPTADALQYIQQLCAQS